MGLLHKVGNEWPDDNLPTWCSFTPKDVRYFMNMANSVKESESPCPSRQIGVVIADPMTGTLVSIGHNGPPDGCPACDNEDYIKNVFWPQLRPEEKRIALKKYLPNDELGDDESLDGLLDTWMMCVFGDEGKICPRKLIDAPSGQRLELCTCAHGETNSIIRAHRSVAGCWMFCACGVPCIDCTKLIVNSRIYCAVVIDHGRGDYSPHSSRWIFKHSRTNLLLLSPEWLAKKN